MKHCSVAVTFFLFLSGFLQAGTIEPGAVYKMTTLHAGNRALFIENSSLDNNAKALVWTETGANSQRWRISADETGNYYYLINVYSGKTLRMNGNAVQGAEVNQASQTNANSFKWEITPVETPGYEDCYYIACASPASGNVKLYMELVNGDHLNSDGSPLQVGRKSDEVLPRQIWKLEKTEEIPNSFTVAIRDDIAQSWKTKYYHQEDGGYTMGGGFWGGAENMEILLDAYETTGNAEYKTLFEESYKTFLKQNSTNWQGNPFNDDIAWACIASVRAYLMFGNPTGINYLNNAKLNFDRMYSRALLKKNNLFLLRWKEGGGDGTTSCINGPAEVCACYLAVATGDKTYYDKAQMLYANQRTHLYNPETGQVYDSRSENGELNAWASTYNQGTYLGAAVMLYNYFGDEQYKEDAGKIIRYAREHLCNSNGIINVCGGGADLPGFKGILMRYVRRYITDLRHPEYVDWLQANAVHAYNNRNSDGVIWTAWWEKSTENYKRGDQDYDSFGCGTAVSAAVNAPLDKNTVIKKAFARIEAGSFNYIKGVLSENNTEGETMEITRIMDGHYLGYNNVDFKHNQANNIVLSVANGTGERQIEIRLDSVGGTLIATAVIPSGDGSWTTVNTPLTLPVDGMKNIYLVFKGAENGLKFNAFHFTASAFIYPDITDNGGSISASHPVSEPGNIENLIDNRLNSVFSIACGTAENAWIQYQSPAPVSLKGYALASGNGNETSDPQDWKLQASNNGTDWTDLDTQSGQTFAARYQIKKYDVSASNTYTHFRLLVTQKRGNAEDWQGAEWQLYGTALSDNDITSDGGQLSGEANDRRLQYNAKARYHLTAYSLTSTGNSSDQDPESWTLYGSNDGEDWTEIDSQYGQVFAYRAATQTYLCSPDIAYSQFKLLITANGGSEETQLNAWQLFGNIAYDLYYTDITANGGQLTASENTENLQALTDKNAGSIYTANATALPVWIQYKTDVPTQAIAYSITSSGENAANDPKSWTLQGSTNGETWTNIQQRNNETFELRYLKKNYTLSSTALYTYFRLQINSAYGAEATEVKIAEWELFGTSIGNYDITSNVGGELSAQFEGNANEGYTRLTDKSKNAKYCVSNQKTFWAKYRTSRAARLLSYSLTSANDNPDRDPKSWILYASTDDREWTEIDRRENETFPFRYATQYYLCPTADKYTYFKLEITENAGSSTVQLAEWQLLGEYNDYIADLTENGGTLTASHPASGGTALQSLIDNSESTKYYLYIASMTDGVWFQYQSPVPVTLASYALTSANENPNNDPKAWLLQASGNGAEWTDIDTQENRTFIRGERKVFKAASGSAYPFYRLLITERNRNADRGLHLAEWELFDTDQTNIRLPEKESTVKMYPNPAAEYLTIETPEKAHFAIYDINGQLLQTQELQAGKEVIPVEHFKPGLYIVRIKAPGFLENKKLVIK
jgi:predicted alpha-1,6-mannanase (GH76 family)